MEDFYTGDRRINYCLKCKKVDPNPVTKEGRLYCHVCQTRLRTKGAGLALSGGGYRAALFHIGTLWRLNELGWLKRLAEVTSVSGGSITAGWLGLQWKNLKFGEDGVATNFEDGIVKPLREFCSHGIEGEGFFCGLARPYRRFFGKATLQNLPPDKKGPRFTIYATSLQTGVSVRFSRPYLADYNLGEIREPKIELAKAVAASSAFPPIMNPVMLKFKPTDWKDWPDRGKKKDIPGKEKMRKTMALTDGGVYDNMGLERVWDRYTTVLVSDAGAPFSPTSGTCWRGLNRLSVTRRVIDTITEQTRRLRRRWAVTDFIEGASLGTYWGITTHISDYELVEHGLPPPLLKDSKATAALSRIGTRLKGFSQKEQKDLINWGYALTDAGMRRYVLEAGAKPGHLPCSK